MKLAQEKSPITILANVIVIGLINTGPFCLSSLAVYIWNHGVVRPHKKGKKSA